MSATTQLIPARLRSGDMSRRPRVVSAEDPGVGGG
jgi:hypothetical protein